MQLETADFGDPQAWPNTGVERVCQSPSTLSEHPLRISAAARPLILFAWANVVNSSLSRQPGRVAQRPHTFSSCFHININLPYGLDWMGYPWPTLESGRDGWAR